MKATTEQLVSALRVLSVEIHSEDGVANAVIAEAADRMTLLVNLVAQHVQETKDNTEQMHTACKTMVRATETIQSLRDRIKRLEEAGNEIEMILLQYASRAELPRTMAIEQSDLSKRLCVNWRKAKEDKL